eukprot:219376-Prorocentrum_minimum.AAC.1
MGGGDPPDARVGVAEVLLEGVDGEERLVRPPLRIPHQGVLATFTTTLGKNSDTSRPTEMQAMSLFKPSSFCEFCWDLSRSWISRLSSSYCTPETPAVLEGALFARLIKPRRAKGKGGALLEAPSPDQGTQGHSGDYVGRSEGENFESGVEITPPKITQPGFPSGTAPLGYILERSRLPSRVSAREARGR